MPEHSRKPLSSSSFPSTVYYALMTSQLNFCFYIRSHGGKKHCNRAFKTKPIEQYFSVVLFIMLYTVVLRLCPCMESWKVAIQMRATEQYFLVFHSLWCKEVYFESVGEILKCDHSNESVLLSSTQFPVALSMLLQGGSNFWVCIDLDQILKYENPN